MEGLSDCYSRLLYTIYKLHRDGRITEASKALLKAKTIKDDANVLHAYTNYLNHNDVSLLQDELIEQITKPPRSKPSVIGLPGRKSPDSEEDSSPLGNFLKRRKKEHTGEHHEVPMSWMRPVQVSEDAS